MNAPARMSTTDFFLRAERLYGWDLSMKEKTILYNLAKAFGGNLILENWELFQIRNQGHPPWEFEEWFHENLLNGDNEIEEEDIRESEAESGSCKKYPEWYQKAI